jgi:hypothetical protein
VLAQTGRAPCGRQRAGGRRPGRGCGPACICALYSARLIIRTPPDSQIGSRRRPLQRAPWPPSPLRASGIAKPTTLVPSLSSPLRLVPQAHPNPSNPHCRARPCVAWTLIAAPPRTPSASPGLPRAEGEAWRAAGAGAPRLARARRVCRCVCRHISATLLAHSFPRVGSLPQNGGVSRYAVEIRAAGENDVSKGLDQTAGALAAQPAPLSRATSVRQSRDASAPALRTRRC